jgi:hypothetical protein
VTGGPRRPDRPQGAGFWVAAVVGLGVIGFGVRGILTHAEGTEPPEFAKWVVGADLLHDFVLAPLVCLVAAAVARFLPARVRAPVGSGLIATAFVVAVGWAPLRGYGRATVPDNPTVQPLDYTTAVATVLAVVWAVVALWLAVAWRRGRRGRAHDAVTSGGTRARSANPAASPELRPGGRK